MAFIYAWGGNPDRTSGYVIGTVLIEQHGFTCPSGNLSLTGTRPIRIYGVRPDYVSGGSGVSYAISYRGVLVGSAAKIFSSSGGTFTMRIQNNGGTLYFGRNTAQDWPIYENGVVDSVLRGVISSQFTWDAVPGVVTNPHLTYTPGSTSATVTFAYPAADGGNAINDYVLEYTRLPPGGSWSGWINAVPNVNGSHTWTGLISGYKYAFSVYARNDVGSGQRWQSPTVQIGAGGAGQIYDAGAWSPASARIYDAGQWVPATGQIYDSGSWSPVS